MGLAAAKTYLEINPGVELTIIDEESTVGGVWSGSRSYPGLIADSCASVFDYSDFPMDVEMDIGSWADLPAEKVHEYFERYTDKFQLRDRCRLNTRVVRAERHESKADSGAIWKISVEARQLDDKDSIKETLLCDKLIVATGTSSTPKMPTDIDWATFEGPILHSKDVGTEYPQLLADNVKRVTVVGGNKSAVDVVNMCALAGKEVDWLIRENSTGPGLLFHSRSKDGTHVGKYKAMRASAVPVPNILVTKGFWYWFLHSGKSRSGAKLLKFGSDQMAKRSIKSFYGTNENTMKIAPDLKEYVYSSFVTMPIESFI
jgi:cation diffusion facilitator CzcD-associated flavoprotein CzcO